MKELKQYNHLKGTEEPEAGTVLYLKKTAPKKPLLRAPLFGNKPNPDFVKNNESDPGYVTGGRKAAVSLAQETAAVVDHEGGEVAAVVESQEEPYNIANEPAVEEQIAQEQITSNEAEEAADEEESELDKLKAKLDRSVYGNQNTANNQAVSKPANNQVVSRPVVAEASYETRPAAQTATRPATPAYTAPAASSKPLSQEDLRKRIEANQRAERETPVVANRSNTTIAKPEPVRAQAQVVATPAKTKVKTEEKKVADKKGTDKKGADKKVADKKAADKKVTDKKNAKDVKPASHTVKKGETVTAIADKYNLTTKEVIKLNKLSANGAVKPGMKLKLK